MPSGEEWQAQVFTGEYRHSVDEKGRVAVPARFRAQLDEGAVICRWVDACLAIFPRSEWEGLAAKVKALPIADASARDFQRFLFAGAFEIELDRQGRFVLPAQSREWARLAGEAVIVGSLDHAEIWAPDRWAERSRDLESPEAMSERLAGLGI
ncbi:MAG TPA: division/cell wall cluster transcriptional repressor MraZ [Candidatus Limnocylindrales bacterium]